MTEEVTIAIERRLLLWLCQGGADAQRREEVLARLRWYPFRSVEHQVLFDCLRGLPADRPDLIQSLLPERLVRAGFPDIDLIPFFEPHGMTLPEATELLEKLVPSAATERHGSIEG